MDIPKHDHEALQALFAAEPLAPHALGLPYAYGFVLHIVSAPDFIESSMWMPMLFKSRALPAFTSKAQMQTVLGALMSIWSFWAEESEDRETLTLPPGCILNADGNASDELLEFCQGYIEGFEWLRDLWEEALAPHGDASLEANILGTAMTLCLRIRKGKTFADEASELPPELKAIPLDQAWERLPDALTDLAALGRALHMEFLRRSGPAQADPKPGRNDPCPCGSGKKYKRCCLK